MSEEKDLVSNLIDAIKNIGVSKTEDLHDHPASEPILEEFTLKGIADYIKKNNCRNIVVATGAGISTSAGIPDFRSKGTGLYDNLQKYNLPSPESIFDISYFKENPLPFFLLAKEMFPTGKYKPTICHYFIKLLSDKGYLLRNYTQNIDTLERLAGIDPEYLVEAHGSFGESQCINCGVEIPNDFVRDEIFKGNIVKCSKCDGLVKPKIVFFGESLPEKFFQLINQDFEKCDLLIVIGTSLKVHPFAKIVELPKPNVPRVLINLSKVGEVDPLMQLLKLGSNGFDFSEKGTRDVFFKGTCDNGCLELAKLLGWEEELYKIQKEKDLELEKEWKKQEKLISEYQE